MIIEASIFVSYTVFLLLMGRMAGEPKITIEIPEPPPTDKHIMMVKNSYNKCWDIYENQDGIRYFRVNESCTPVEK